MNTSQCLRRRCGARPGRRWRSTRIYVYIHIYRSIHIYIYICMHTYVYIHEDIEDMYELMYIWYMYRYEYVIILYHVSINKFMEHLKVAPQAEWSTAGQKVTFHAHRNEGGWTLNIFVLLYRYWYSYIDIGYLYSYIDIGYLCTCILI